MYITFEEDKPVDQEEVQPTGESAESERQARLDLPTLPLSLRQTPGGYKAIDDAEGRLVTFVGMREDDRAWGDFLITRANAHDALVEAATAAIKVLKLEFPGSIKRKAAIAQLEATLSLVDGNQETK